MFTCLRALSRSTSTIPRLSARYIHGATDSCGIPLKPTWSVNELLSSYPTPTISSSTLNHIHSLSALIPPAEGTPEHSALKREMEDLVKLVEAVRLFDSDTSEDGVVPDGRVLAEGIGLPLSDCRTGEEKDVDGSELLRHSTRTSDGLYVVDSERTR